MKKAAPRGRLAGASRDLRPRRGRQGRGWRPCRGCDRSWWWPAGRHGSCRRTWRRWAAGRPHWAVCGGLADRDGDHVADDHHQAHFRGQATEAGARARSGAIMEQKPTPHLPGRPPGFRIALRLVHPALAAPAPPPGAAPARSRASPAGCEGEEHLGTAVERIQSASWWPKRVSATIAATIVTARTAASAGTPAVPGGESPGAGRPPEEGRYGTSESTNRGAGSKPAS